MFSYTNTTVKAFNIVLYYITTCKIKFIIFNIIALHLNNLINQLYNIWCKAKLLIPIIYNHKHL